MDSSVFLNSEWPRAWPALRSSPTLGFFLRQAGFFLPDVSFLCAFGYYAWRKVIIRKIVITHTELAWKEETRAMPSMPQVTVEATVIARRGRAVFTYRLTNTGSAALGEFALAVPAEAGLRAPSAPPGWLALYVPAQGRMVWQSAGPPTDLAPGGMLDGFRFQAGPSAGPAAYRVRHFAADGRAASRGVGVTQAPAAPSDALAARRGSKMYRFPANPAFGPVAGLLSRHATIGTHRVISERIISEKSSRKGNIMLPIARFRLCSQPAPPRRQGHFAPALLLMALLAFIALGAAPAAQAITYHVRGSDTIGLDQSVDNAVSGDTIQIDSGTFYLIETLAPQTGVTIVGAGAGSTILDGIGKYQIMYVSPGVTVALSGLTLQNGTAGNGGGLDNAGTVTLTNCTLSGNTATNNGLGGGIFNDGTQKGGLMTLTGCTLSGNSVAGLGGGGGLANEDGTVTLTNCVLSGNTAGGGGGVWNFSGTVTLSGCTFTQNSAIYSGYAGSGNSYGGAVMNLQGGTVTLSQCALTQNTARRGIGGGVYNAAGGVTLSRCALTQNSATGDALGEFGSGGGFYNLDKATLTACTLSGNTAAGSGGISNGNNATLTLTECTFTGNTAPGGRDNYGELVGGGGGGLGNGGTATLTECTFTGNTAAVRAGGLVNSGTATLTDDIFWNNSAPSSPELTNSTVTYCDIQGGYAGTGNFSADPLFVNGTSAPYDVHLRPGSPCIGAGTTNAPAYTSFDLDGVLRPDPPTVGAYEGYEIVVTNTGAAGAGSLAAAVTAADAAPDAVITFDPAVFGTSPQTIALAGTLSVTGRTTILGPAGGVVLDGGGQHGIMTVASGVPVFLSGLTLQNGNSGGSGGGINNAGALTVTDCALLNNVAYRTGGAINNGNNATLILTNCTLSGNSAGRGSGGAVFNGQSSTATLTDDILWNDSAFNGSEISETYGGASATFCDIQGGYAGTGNFSADPLFVRAPDTNGSTDLGDLHLRPDSPCIGAGTTNAPAYTSFDLDGASRPNPPTVGAYEGYEVLVTRTMLASSLNPSLSGQLITFTAAVSDLTLGDPTPTGTIQFTANGTALGAPVSLNSNGMAQISTTMLPTGSINIQATYNGDTDHSGGSASLTQTVNPASVTGVSVGWGSQTAPLTSGAALPWLGIKTLVVTLNSPAGLAPGDVSLTGKAVASYGPVTISQSGSVYTLTLAKPITAPDRLTLTVGNAGVNSYSASFSVLPGDVSGDGAVNASDMALVKNAIGGTYNQTDDIDGSSAVDASDYTAVRQRVGTKLP